MFHFSFIPNCCNLSFRTSLFNMSRIILLCCLVFLLACKAENTAQNPSGEVEIFVTNELSKGYELYKVKDSKATLVLYPGAGSTAKQTKEEFDVLSAAAANQVSVLLMNFNQHLWIDELQTKELAEQLEAVFNQYQLDKHNAYIGGMSIGGNIALTLSNYLHQNQSEIAPKGCFIIDSPIDLYALYQSSKKDLLHPDFDAQRRAEPQWIVNYFEEHFTTESMLVSIQKVSPFTSQNRHINVTALKQCKLRFYTEPDSLWWSENRQMDFEQTNAYTIQQFAQDLRTKNWKQFELIETNNKGYRANGLRHPHSWSIVDVPDLLDWIRTGK